MSEPVRRRPASGDRGAPDRLDLPLAKRRRWMPQPRMDPESFGEFAERFARFMGTARFLVWMTVFVIVWLAWNVLAPASLTFDPYAFIFLTLMLSLQASYAAPLILLAQNRQDDRDKVQMEQDRARDEQGLADTEFLTREVAALRLAMREVATRDFVRSELRTLLEEMETRAEERGRELGRSRPADGSREEERLPDEGRVRPGGPGDRPADGPGGTGPRRGGTDRP